MVERRTELLGYCDEGDGVIARLRGPDGREENCEAAYIAGCDGVRSSVRETMGTGFAGGTYRHLFYVADVNASGLAIDGELNADIEASCWCTISSVQRPRPRWTCSTISRPAATKSCS